MLVVAMPKSASTSLKYSIAENGFIEAFPKVRKENYNVTCEGFSQFQLTLTTCFDFDASEINNWLINRNYIFKKHILPTERHFKILGSLKIPFVLLLRNTEDVYDSFVRNVKEHEKIYDWKYDLDMLKIEIDMFNEYWLKFSEYKDYILKITYNDLILNYQNTMDNIFKHLKLRQRIEYLPLQKKAFTGVGLKRLENKK